MAKPHMCPPALLSKSLDGQRIIVTRANSGIGFETAQQLARQGADVILACRRVDEGERRAQEIRSKYSEAKVTVEALDLGKLQSVNDFADRVLAQSDTLNGLLNNAGVMNTPNKKTADGFEMQIGVNHLGHFLLAERLTDALKKGAPSRIVNVSSCYHDKAVGREGKIVLDDLNFENRKYDGWEAYAQSKLANLLHARGLAERLEGTGVTAVSVHPGWVRTDLAKNTMPLFMQNFVLRPVFRIMGMIEPWEGAQSSLYAMLADDVTEHSGEYFSQLGLYREKKYNKGGWPMSSPNPAAHDASMVDALWDKSRQLVGLAS